MAKIFISRFITSLIAIVVSAGFVQAQLISVLPLQNKRIEKRVYDGTTTYGAVQLSTVKVQEKVEWGPAGERTISHLFVTIFIVHTIHNIVIIGDKEPGADIEAARGSGSSYVGN